MKLGVFGGTFDPIHWGHLVLAEEARNAAGLERILLVPSGVPPHKAARELTVYAHRLAMARLAVAGCPHFEVSDVESTGDGPHYSLDTLAELSRRHPGAAIHFLLGSDSLLEMSGWRNPGEIARRFPLVVLPRPGFDVRGADPSLASNMTVVEGISVSISSTLVRRRLAGGRPVRFLVPETVLDYATRHGLYRSDAG